MNSRENQILPGQVEALRWWGILGTSAVFVAANQHLSLDLSWLPAIMITVLAILSNLIFRLHRIRTQEVSSTQIAIPIVLDVLLLTAGLYFYGGHANPFSTVYLAFVSLAAFFLGARWAWAIFTLSALCFFALFFWQVPVAAFVSHGHHGNTHSGFDLHLHGMFLVFLLIGSSTSYFTSRMVRELNALRDARHRSEKLASIATLAAGAAHELATPIGTAILITESLEEIYKGEPRYKELVTELLRARNILSRMRASNPESVIAKLRAVRAMEIIERSIERISERSRSQIKIRSSSELTLQTDPTLASEILYLLLKNSCDACDQGKEIVISYEVQPVPKILIKDNGPGIPPSILEKLGEPFVTTKEPGDGMGLGIYLARSIAERIGAEIDLTSDSSGTTATLNFMHPVQKISGINGKR